MVRLLKFRRSKCKFSGIVFDNICGWCARFYVKGGHKYKLTFNQLDTSRFRYDGGRSKRELMKNNPHIKLMIRDALIDIQHTMGI